MHAVRRTLLAVIGAGLLTMLAASSAQALSVVSESVSHVTGTDARVEAVINTEGLPNGALDEFQVVSSPSEFFDELACSQLNSSLCLGVGVHPGALGIAGVEGEMAGQLVSDDVNSGGRFGSAKLTLMPGTTYEYRVITEAVAPTVDVFRPVPPLVVGPVQVFRTLAPPIVATDGATATGPRTARIEGNADPEGQETMLHADYALASEPWCTSGGAEGTPLETAPQSLGSGNVMISEIGVPLAELTPASEYCAELVASNVTGTSHGGQVRFTTPQEIEQLSFSGWTVSGSISPMHFGQPPIALPSGATFDGSGELNPMTGEGGVSGSLAIPPFTSTVKRLGITFKPVGLTLSEVAPLAGTLAPAMGVAGEETLTIPAKLELGVTSVGIFGLKIKTACTTAQPLSLTLADTLTREELRSGLAFKGMTVVPAIKCKGSFLGAFLGPLLTGSLSGPAAYSIAVKAP